MSEQTPDQVIQTLQDLHQSGDVKAIRTSLDDMAAQHADNLNAMLEIADRLIDLPQDDLACDCLDVMGQRWPNNPQVKLRQVQRAVRFDDQVIAIAKAKASRRAMFAPCPSCGLARCAASPMKAMPGP